MAEAPVVAPAAAPAAPAAIAPVVAPAAAPAVAPAVAPAAPAANAPAVSDWLTGADADTVGLATLKGWKGPLDAVQAYKHAQSFVGADPKTIVRLPAADADKATKDAFYTALGRPADAKGYEIAVPTGTDPAYGEFARGAFHELGLSAEQGKALVVKNNEFIAKQTAEAAAARATRYEAENVTLAKEWGAASAQNKALVDKAVHVLGVDDATLAQLRDTMGPLKAMKFFHQLATKIGEDSFVAPENKVTGFDRTLTPPEAKARIVELRNDKDWSKAYLNGDTAKKAEMQQLQAWANPDQK